MEPTLSGGSRVLVNRWAYRRRPLAVGEVVAFRHPFNTDKVLLKRVAAVCAHSAQLHANQYFLVGDHLEDSHASRRFGPVAQRHVIGKVVLRY